MNLPIADPEQGRTGDVIVGFVAPGLWPIATKRFATGGPIEQFFAASSIASEAPKVLGFQAFPTPHPPIFVRHVEPFEVALDGRVYAVAGVLGMRGPMPMLELRIAVPTGASKLDTAVDVLDAVMRLGVVQGACTLEPEASWEPAWTDWRSVLETGEPHRACDLLAAKPTSRYFRVTEGVEERVVERRDGCVIVRLDASLPPALTPARSDSAALCAAAIEAEIDPNVGRHAVVADLGTSELHGWDLEAWAVVNALDPDLAVSFSRGQVAWVTGPASKRAATVRAQYRAIELGAHREVPIYDATWRDDGSVALDRVHASLAI